jgi:hypothetical protein
MLRTAARTYRERGVVGLGLVGAADVSAPMRSSKTSMNSPKSLNRCRLSRSSGSAADGRIAATTDWGAYPVDEAALRHDAGVEEETSDKSAANARFPERVSTRYRGDWLQPRGSIKAPSDVACSGCCALQGWPPVATAGP